MIKYILDYKDAKGSAQYEAIRSEVVEASNEYFLGNEEEEKQELCDVIQACYSRFMQLGMTQKDIGNEWDKHYKKEIARGRNVVEIPWEDLKYAQEI